MLETKAGDILLYYRPHGSLLGKIAEELIQFGETREDGEHKKEYFHTAIALSNSEKIEADGVQVAKAPIKYDGNFDIFRPKVQDGKTSEAIQYILTLEGEKYDWTLIVDDALRYISENVVHLPVELIEEKEKTEKICSTLATVFLIKEGVVLQEDVHKFNSPEDVGILLHGDLVNE